MGVYKKLVSQEGACRDREWEKQSNNMEEMTTTTNILLGVVQFPFDMAEQSFAIDVEYWQYAKAHSQAQSLSSQRTDNGIRIAD